MQPQIIPRSEHCISRKNIDPDALKVLYRLYRSGHTAFLVGGGVRDLLIGRKPKDFDVSTSARPGQVKKLFRNCWLIGRRFRLAHIHFRDHKIIEVSTFRSEPTREEGESEDDLLVRRDNTFGTPEEDALRRDFTINGMFYDIASFSLIDYVGGVDDIESGVIRTIGEPRIRFQEDPVRMIRAVKFAARLDFAVEPDTWDALCELGDDIRKSSTSRVMEEVARLLEGGASCRSLQLLKASGLLPVVLPEIYEYFQGIPAGPGMQREGRRDVEVPETFEEVPGDDPEADVEEEILAEVDEGEGLDQDDMVADDLEEGDATGAFEDGGEGARHEGDGPAFDTVYDRMDPGVNLGTPYDMPDDAFARVTDGVPSGGADAPVVEMESDLLLDAEGDDAVEDEVEEEALVLLEEDDGAVVALTPEGTRCVQAPDRGARLWRMLSAVDLLIRSGRTLSRPTLYAALLMPVVTDTAEWLAQRKGEGEDPLNVFPRVLRPLTGSVLISRRDRERVCQILMAQRKCQRKSGLSLTAFARKPYFAEALDLFEISVLATGDFVDVLDWWRRRFPPTSSAPGRHVEVEEPRGGGGRTRRRSRSMEPAGREVRPEPHREPAEELDPEGEEDRPRRRRRRRRRPVGGER